MPVSAIWEMIPITQEADVLVEKSFGRTRPGAAIRYAKKSLS